MKSIFTQPICQGRACNPSSRNEDFFVFYHLLTEILILSISQAMKYLYASFLAFLAIGIVACGYSAMDGGKFSLCSEKYALCTSAQCIPNPTHPDQTICFCEVQEGINLGKMPCSKRIPYTDNKGGRHLVSTFSLEQFSAKKQMVCESGSWSNCLDQPCVVNPLDPSKALCMCKIVRSGKFETLGGNCDTSTCEKGYWSGATTESNLKNIQVLVEALNLGKNPRNYCPK